MTSFICFEGSEKKWTLPVLYMYNPIFGNVMFHVPFGVLITHTPTQAIDRCINHINWYLFRRGRCKMGHETGNMLALTFFFLINSDV